MLGVLLGLPKAGLPVGQEVAGSREGLGQMSQLVRAGGPVQQGLSARQSVSVLLQPPDAARDSGREQHRRRQASEQPEGYDPGEDDVLAAPVVGDLSELAVEFCLL